jgi:hypothetical protein
MATAARITLVALAASIAVARAEAAGSPADDGGHPLRLAVGQSVALCSTGTLLCPARATFCDDTSVVVVGGDERGPVLTGMKPGTTVCSAASASGSRRVYRVTVGTKPTP